MSIELISTIKPKNNGAFAIADNFDIKGGIKVVANEAELSTITAARREYGMLVFSNADGYFYQLQSDLTTWTHKPDIFFSTGGKLGGNDVLVAPLGASQDGYALTWVDANSRWEAAPIPVQFVAAGDLSGSAQSQTVIKIQGSAVSATPPSTTAANLLVWNPETPAWAPVSLSGDVVLDGYTGNVKVTQINGTVLGDLSGAQDGYVLSWSGTEWVALPGLDLAQINVGDEVAGYLDAKLQDGYNIDLSVHDVPGGADYMTFDFAPEGDISRISGTATLVVTALQGNAVADIDPATGDVLVWKSDGYYAPSALAGDVTGPIDSNTVTKIRGYAVDATAPSAGQVLFWHTDGDGYYLPGASFTPGGDLYGTVSTQYVSQLTGAESTQVVHVPTGVVLGFDGYIHLQAGAGDAYLKAGEGADVTIASVDNNSSGNAGDVIITAGNAPAGAAGNVIITVGNGSPDGNIELNTDSTGVVTINSDKVLAQHVISPDALTGNQNNYAPTNLAKCSVIRLSSVNSYNITGFGSITTNGILMKTIFNVGSANITLKNNDSGSITSNKIIVPGGFDFVLEPNDSVGIFYDTITADGIWRLC